MEHCAFFQSGGILRLSSTVEDKDDTTKRSLDWVLKKRYPPVAPIYSDTLMPQIAETMMLYHPVLFDRLTGNEIRKSALQTEGAAGPSSIDTAGW